MRPDLRLRLREITKSLSTAEKRVTRVTRVTEPPGHTPSHVAVTRSAPEKVEQNQCVTPVTRVTRCETAGEDVRHTSPGVTVVVTEGVTAASIEPEDWLAHFEERAAIREYEGGFDRAEAERLALDDTVSLLGPKPGQRPCWHPGEEIGAIPPDKREIGRAFEEMIAGIGLDELMRLGEIASQKVRSRYVKMGPAERALFHTKHGVGVVVGARPPTKVTGRSKHKVPFDETTRPRLAAHYKGLRHSSGTTEETALLRHNVLAYWSQSGIPTEFLDELRASTEAGR